MDIVFCVENGIVAFTSKVLYAGNIIKKIQYWQTSVPGYLVNWNFPDKEVGYVYILEADTENYKKLHIFFSKEPD